MDCPKSRICETRALECAALPNPVLEIYPSERPAISNERAGKARQQKRTESNFDLFRFSVITSLPWVIIETLPENKLTH